MLRLINPNLCFEINFFTNRTSQLVKFDVAIKLF